MSVGEDSAAVNGQGDGRSRHIDLDGPQSLVVIFDGETHCIPPSELSGDGRSDDWRQRLNSASDAHVNIEPLLSWTDNERWQVLQFLVEAPRQGSGIMFCVCESDAPTGNLFDCVLALIDRYDNLSRQGRSVRAAVEVVALLYPNDLEPACQQVVQRLEDRRISRGYRISSLLADARDRVAELLEQRAGRNGDEEDLQLVRREFSDAPVPLAAVVPVGYRLTQNGVCKVDVNNSRPILAPIVVTRTLTDLHSGIESIEVAWRRQNQWQRHTAPRSMWAAARRVVDLADCGLPVTSNNASELVQFVADFEAANVALLPSSRVSQRMGYLGSHGRGGFLWGRSYLSADNRGQELADQSITFQGADEGDEQIADGFHSGGDFDEWRAVVAPLANHGRAQLGLYASFAPPMLQIIDSPNFVVSYAGTTSIGKTTVQVVAASCWGCPDLSTQAAAITSWNSTKISVERRAALLNAIPLVVDDTKNASDKEQIARTVYEIASGRGRGRGSTQGSQRVGTWRTILISSGEEQLGSFTKDGGARARILEHWGEIFGSPDESTTRLVTQLNEGLKEHYGHAGPSFVRFLLDNRSRWNCWRREYRELRQSYQQRATNSVATRMAAHFAALEISSVLAHEALCLPWNYQANTLSEFWDRVTADTGEADQSVAALRHTLSWAQSRESQFEGRTTRQNPNWECLGRWEVPDGEGGNRALAIYPHKVDEVLKAAGFAPTAIRRLWNDRGWLRTSPGKTTLKVRVSGRQSQEMVAIRWAAVEQLIGDADDDRPSRPRPERPRRGAEGEQGNG